MYLPDFFFVLWPLESGKINERGFHSTPNPPPAEVRAFIEWYAQSRLKSSSLWDLVWRHSPVSEQKQNFKSSARTFNHSLLLRSLSRLYRSTPQTDLEMVTEDLAQKVNRPYLRTPCHKIIRAACLVQQKRQEFLASVARGVAPNDSPEAPRRRLEGQHTRTC